MFLGDRIPFRRARVVDESGEELGAVDAVELVTIGQRRGLSLPGGSPKRFVLDVDVESRTIVVGDEASLSRHTIAATRVQWGHEPPALGSLVRIQTSAHGAAHTAVLEELAADSFVARWQQPQRRVAPGQSAVLYDSDDRVVLGGGTAL